MLSSSRPSLRLVPFATKVFPEFFLTNSHFRKSVMLQNTCCPTLPLHSDDLGELLLWLTKISLCNPNEFSEVLPPVSVLPNHLGWTTQGYPLWGRRGQVCDTQEDRLALSVCFYFVQSSPDSRERGERFSLRGDKIIRMFKNFQMNSHNVMYSIGSVGASLLRMLFLNAPYSCGPDVQPQAPGSLCPAWS